MALYETTIRGDLQEFVDHVEREITGSSVSTKTVESAGRRVGDARLVVGVYERYSIVGGNRVSLQVSVLAVDGEDLYVVAATSGGSQAMLFKVNTLGESSFLDVARRAIDSFDGAR